MMIADAAPLRGLRRAYAAALSLLVLMPAVAAAADIPGCGVWEAQGGDSNRLVIERAGEATIHGGMNAPEPWLFTHEDGVLLATNLEDGYTSSWETRDDGATIEMMFRTFTRVSSTTCKPAVPPPDACRADIAHCVEQRSTLDDMQLRDLCGSGLPFACNTLMDRWLAEQRASDEEAAGEQDGPPPVCRKGTRTYKADACEKEIATALATALAESMLRLGSRHAQLPPARLDELEGLCRKAGSAGFCGNVAESLWDGGHYLRARDALELACTRGDEATCERLPALRQIGAADVTAPGPAMVPCGRFVTERALVDTLDFGQGGMVDVGHGQTLRARFEDGLVRIRHDKGDDFLFAPVGGNRLLGRDGWNRYSVYSREGEAGTCTPPRVIEEVALPSDCPASSARAAARCCAAGRLQGCNIAGNLQALDGNWDGARSHYLPVCRAGIREGCENLRTTFENSGDEQIVTALEEVCATSAARSHVACDVLDTTNWRQARALAELSRRMGELERNIEQGTGAAGGDASPTRVRRGGKLEK